MPYASWFARNPVAKALIFNPHVHRKNGDDLRQKLREEQNRDREDERDHARLVHLERQIALRAAIHLIAAHAAGIGNRDLPFAFVQIYDAGDEQDRHDGESE